MANPIKYSTTQVANTIKKGNSVLGVGNNGFGASSETGFWAGVDPPNGGYTVYVNTSGTSGPRIYIADDNSLSSLVNQIGASGITTLSGALEWIDSQSSIICVNREYEGIVTNGLVLNLDAGFIPSYPRSGTVWRDISGNGNDVTLYNGISYQDGALVSDGINDYGRTNNTLNLSGLSAITINVVCKQPTTTTHALIYEHTSNYNSFNNYGSVRYGGFGFSINSNGNSTVENYGHFQLIGNNGQAAANAPLPTTTNYQYYTTVYDFARSGGSGDNETTVYVNGIQPTQVPYGSNNTQTFVNDYLYLWSRGGSSFFRSSIAQLSIYNRALSANEVLQNFNATKSRFGL